MQAGRGHEALEVSDDGSRWGRRRPGPRQQGEPVIQTLVRVAASFSATTATVRLQALLLPHAFVRVPDDDNQDKLGLSGQITADFSQ